jgi:hypothetical protein
MSQRINSNYVKFNVLDESAIKSLLKSDIFTKNESIAVEILFTKTNTKSLTESIVKKLDESVKIIVESSYEDILLSEGFFSDILDGLKGLGDKAKEVLSGGWGKIKAVWGQFSELVKEVAGACKEGLIKVFGMFSGKAKQAADKAVTDLEGKVTNVQDKSAFAKEVQHLVDSGNYVKDTFFNKWVSAPTWEKTMVDGSISPEGDVKVDPAKAEDGLEDLEKMESFKSMKSNLIRERNKLFSNKGVVRELYNLSKNKSFIMEGGGFAHLESAIKNPFLKGIVEWSIKILQTVFAPIAKVTQIVTGFVGEQLLNKFSEGVKLLGGPGAFKFVVIAGILSEVLEVVVKFITPSGPQLIAQSFFPPLAPILASYKLLLGTISGILVVYSLSTALINMAPSLQKFVGIGAKKESYEPTGKFKIQDGNLLYVKHE